MAVRVKRRGKSPPDGSATNHARQAPSGARPNRGGGWPGQCLPGRLLEGVGDCSPRLMAVAASVEAVQNPAYRPTSNDYFMRLMWQFFCKVLSSVPFRQERNEASIPGGACHALRAESRSGRISSQRRRRVAQSSWIWPLIIYMQTVFYRHA